MAEFTDETGINYQALLKAGGLYGAGCWLVGILISQVLFRAVPLNPGSGLANANIDIALQDIPAWRLAGYVYYGGHFVKITPEDLMYGSINLATYTGAPHLLLAFVLPGVLLVAGSYLFVSRHAPESVSRAHVYGASLAAGYALLMIFGVFLFDYHTTDDFGNRWAMTLSMSRAAIFGILYPVVFGAIGGRLAFMTSSSPTRRGQETVAE